MRDGFLAIWSDVDPAVETDYLHWMSREHARERVSIPGFLSMRMFRSIDATKHRYFILYELGEAAVVNDAAYLARLNQPTAWSRRMMPQLLNFMRGGGRIAERFGCGQGGFAAAVRIGSGAIPAAAGIAAEAPSHDRIASARVLVTDDARTSVQTREKGMRTGDVSFDAVLMIEGFDLEAVRTAIAGFGQRRSNAHIEASDAIFYVTIFSLDRNCISARDMSLPPRRRE